MIESAALARSLSDLSTAVSRLEGRRDALRARAAVLRREVELAKGRLAVRGEVEAFVEAAHARASRRNLGTFEILLTALVQEVLPGEKPVSLALSTDRGLPALDVCLARPDGTLEDAFEDNGGAVTNVIGMALRLIAVVKAGVGRFLALDEADCWIAPERVASFYRVLEDGAARLGVQCLAVSHHDLAEFEGRLHIARIAGDPLTGVDVLSSDPSAAWSDGQPGLRSIRLVNVQAYRDATLRLGPGVNALIGPNNRGKSTFVRALRAVFYGEARDSLVRAGEKSAIVEIGMAGGRTLRFSRQPRRTPVNIWSLHEPDGSVVEDAGLRYETGGRSVPDWVESLFRITKVEDLDVHIAHQKLPVFLLGEPPSRRSAVLSIGQEASYARDMIAIHKERCTRDLALVRTGERELIANAASLEELEAIEPLKAALAQAHRRAEDVRTAADRLAALEMRAATLADLSHRLRHARARLSATAGLPEPGPLAALRLRLDEAREREALAARLQKLVGDLATNRARLALLDRLPAGAPAPESTAAAEAALAKLRDLAARAAAQRRRMDSVDESLAAVRADLSRLMEETGGRCPTCGSTVDPDALLANHGHDGREAA